MNTLVIVLIAAVCLFGAYVLYGRWLANKWGIDPAAKTPAVVHEDGRDYVPTNGWTVFAHQFSSIAGAGPVTGAILRTKVFYAPGMYFAGRQPIVPSLLQSEKRKEVENYEYAGHRIDRSGVPVWRLCALRPLAG